MEKICKNCKYCTILNSDFHNPLRIVCNNSQLVQPPMTHKFHLPNEYFGCNLFEYKDIKLNFDTTCDLEEGCDSCSS